MEFNDFLMYFSLTFLILKEFYKFYEFQYKLWKSDLCTGLRPVHRPVHSCAQLCTAVHGGWTSVHGGWTSVHRPLAASSPLCTALCKPLCTEVHFRHICAQHFYLCAQSFEKSLCTDVPVRHLLHCDRYK